MTNDVSSRTLIILQSNAAFTPDTCSPDRPTSCIHLHPFVSPVAVYVSASRLSLTRYYGDMYPVVSTCIQCIWCKRGLMPDTVSTVYKYPGRATCIRICIYVDGYMSTDTSCSSGILVDCISATVDLYRFVSSKYSNRRATNWRQFCRRYKIHVDGDKWIQVDTTCIRQHVSWCKRGISLIHTDRERRILRASCCRRRTRPAAGRDD